MRTLVEDYDIVVVGAGHAGCEAALDVYCKCRQYRINAM